MKITWLGHSCFMLEGAEGTLVLDPYSDGSVPGWRLPELKADAVLCSHGHADHAGVEKVKLSGRAHGYGIEAVGCFHDGEGGALRGENIIHIITGGGGVRVAHLGDLGHGLDSEQLARIGRPDVLLIPVGGHFTIDAAQADAIAREIGARVTVPMHYRGEGFGYEVIGPLADFTALRDGAVYADSNSFDPADYEDGATLVLKPVI